MPKGKLKGSGRSRGVIIAPSLLSADFGRIEEEVKAVTRAGADWIHLDVMDGRFVPNLTFGPMMVRAVRKATPLPLDVHLMMVEPEKYINQFAAAGADSITVHAEACPHLHRVLQEIREAGSKSRRKTRVRAAVSLNPATSLAVLDYLLPALDMVLLMTVNPGFGGQEFIPAVLEKIRDLRWLIEEQGLQVDVEVDGGVTVNNIAEIRAAGANVFVTGNTVFSASDYRQVIRDLRRAAERTAREPASGPAF